MYSTRYVRAIVSRAQYIKKQNQRTCFYTIPLLSFILTFPDASSSRTFFILSLFLPALFSSVLCLGSFAKQFLKLHEVSLLLYAVKYIYNAVICVFRQGLYVIYIVSYHFYLLASLLLQIVLLNLNLRLSYFVTQLEGVTVAPTQLLLYTPSYPILSYPYTLLSSAYFAPYNIAI